VYRSSSRAPNIPTHNPYPRLPRRHTDGRTRSLTHSQTCLAAAASINLALRAPTVAGGHVGSRVDADRRGLVVHGQGSSTDTRARTAQVRNSVVIICDAIQRLDQPSSNRIARPKVHVSIFHAVLRTNRHLVTKSVLSSHGATAERNLFGTFNSSQHCTFSLATQHCVHFHFIDRHAGLHHRLRGEATHP
jgi:hypothetical protein